MVPMSREFLLLARPPEAIALHLVRESDLDTWRASQSPEVNAWLAAQDFRAERHRVMLIPGRDGHPIAAVAGLGAVADWTSLSIWHVAALSERLAPLTCVLESAVARLELPAAARETLALGWLIGAYRHHRYRAGPAVPRARLVAPAGLDVDRVVRLAEATAFARDLINAPANDLGPAELAEFAQSLASAHGAQYRCLVGDELLAGGYPLIHAVGQASPRAPRLIDFTWGDPSHPRVTLVGKGVCFDTGGLDLKPSAGMALMKKDMGGAAIALGVARVLMQRGAPVRLRVLIPAVDNAVDGAAYRPGDVWPSRRGLTVEIANTDAEGRLVLADALTEADSEQPALLIDFATLTGAARVALGPELPPVFSNDISLPAQLQRLGSEEGDPVWPMPLWDPYDEELASRIADVANVAASPHAGAIFGALFLRRFVSPGTRWIHFDLYAWNARERPGRPVGAEAQCLRLVDRFLHDTFG